MTSNAPAPENGLFDISDGAKAEDSYYGQSLSKYIQCGANGDYDSTTHPSGFNLLHVNLAKNSQFYMASFVRREKPDTYRVGIAGRPETVAKVVKAQKQWAVTRDDAKDTRASFHKVSTNFKGAHTQHITFKVAFREPPDIVLWLYEWNLQWAEQWRLNVRAANITKDGFDLIIETWNVNKVNGAGVYWIAIKKDKKNTEHGRFVDSATKPGTPKAYDHKDVVFPPGKFKKAPSVVHNISMFDLDAEKPFIIESCVTKVTKDGFRWELKAESKWVQNADFIAISNDDE